MKRLIKPHLIQLVSVLCLLFSVQVKGHESKESLMSAFGYMMGEVVSQNERDEMECQFIEGGEIEAIPAGPIYRITDTGEREVAGVGETFFLYRPDKWSCETTAPLKPYRLFNNYHLTLTGEGVLNRASASVKKLTFEECESELIAAKTEIERDHQIVFQNHEDSPQYVDTGNRTSQWNHPPITRSFLDPPRRKPSTYEQLTLACSEVSAKGTAVLRINFYHSHERCKGWWRQRCYYE